MGNLKLQDKRVKEMWRVGKIVIGLIAIPMILQAIYTDIKIHGVDQTWIALRLGIIPIGIICLVLYRFEFFKKNPSAPVMSVAIYVTAIHLFFVSQTGYGGSIYFHSYIQLLMGFAILPFTVMMYVFGTSFIIGSYVFLILQHAHFDWSVLSQSNVIFLKTYVAMSYATFFIMNGVRNKFYCKEIELESELETRQSIIETKAKELSAAKIALIQQESENSRYKSLGELAAQVAHNVRSPIGSITVIVDSTPEIPPAARIPLLNAIAQIRGVANKLLKSKPHELDNLTSDLELVSVRRLLENVIEEKRLLFFRHPNIEIKTNFGEPKLENIFAKVDPTDFNATVSNLVHNSFEALSDKGTIEVSLARDGNNLVIAVRDNGRGMPEHILNSVKEGHLGLSYLKPNGSGLGISHAKSSVEAWGGKLEIESVERTGTTVRLIIPKTERVRAVATTPLKSRLESPARRSKEALSLSSS